MGLASKLAAAQAAGSAATPGYGPPGAASSPYGAPPQQQQHAQGAFPGQPPSSTGYGAPQQQQQYGAHAPYGQQGGNQYAPPAGNPPPPVPSTRPGQGGQLPYPGAPQQQQGQYGQPQQGVFLYLFSSLSERG
ncbi:hypothetical protein JCM10449v2_007440 [Rhodotorula kratochvilovae]